jgi:hypothetical protein
MAEAISIDKEALDTEKSITQQVDFTASNTTDKRRFPDYICHHALDSNMFAADNCCYKGFLVIRLPTPMYSKIQLRTVKSTDEERRASSDAILPLPIPALVCRSSFYSTSWLEDPTSRHGVCALCPRPILIHDRRSCVLTFRCNRAFEQQFSLTARRMYLRCAAKIVGSLCLSLSLFSVSASAQCQQTRKTN